MQSFSHNVLNPGLPARFSARLVFTRSISLTRAIENGKRKQQDSALRHDRRHQFPSHRQKGQVLEHNQDQQSTSSPSSSSSEPPASFISSISYTTASSEFLYGTFSVLSALRARRRKIYNLYRLPSSSNLELDPESETATSYTVAREEIHHLARHQQVNIQELRGTDALNTFNKLSGRRPHGGLILEVSPLPRLSINALGPVVSKQDDLQLVPSNSTPLDTGVDDLFRLNGNHRTIPSSRPPNQYPFVLLLDGVTNPGNFGAIVRSAWFLGVDAIIIPDHGTSPISPVSIKASAGALELMPVLTIKNERLFLIESRASGWKFFTAAAPPPTKDNVSPNARIEGALSNHPCVLVFGNEKSGPRKFWRPYMHSTVSIPNARGTLGDVDSLNVSVAAALLTQKFFDFAQPSVVPAKDAKLESATSSPFVDSFGLEGSKIF
ncbi:hypothetical protein LTR84_011346 [Exophiala bonariae]|uniref:tRNA/rRNA methyltransferase SpoU type domain-containing protein n=1 Tax=Exophiala bonariae TaxID=1690606 RepID=A0AAV9MRX8_9EURO|nr:hypothetical protein LTR84_011346 [Exophiala bonariae]